MNNESVGKKIVEALKKQAENFDLDETSISSSFSEPEEISNNDFFETTNNDIF